MISLVTKRAEDTQDYAVDFFRWLEREEVISSAVGSVIPGGELAINLLEFNDTAVAVWLTRGQNNTRYVVRIVVTTNFGRMKTLDFGVRVRGRTPEQQVIVSADNIVVSVREFELPPQGLPL